MSGEGPTFGSLLYAELRKQSGYDLMTGLMDYKAIQRLKVSDRTETLKLFSGSSYEVIQLLQTFEPEDAARRLVAKAKDAKQQATDSGAAMLILISSM